MAGLTNEEIKEYIEVKCKDWLQLKLININKENGKYLLDLIDNFGYKYFVDIGVIRCAKGRDTSLSMFFRQNKYTIENINTYLKINNINIKLISNKVNNAKDKIIWECPIHGNFNMSWNCVKKGQNCPTCGNIKIADSKRNSYVYVQEYFKSKDLLLVSKEYINNELPLDFICLKHKDKGVQQTSFGNLLSSVGCRYCSKENTLIKVTKSHEQYLSEVDEVHGNKYKVIGKYNGCKNKIEVYCNK